MKQPNRIEVGNEIIKILDKDDYFNKPKNRSARIITELFMREMYFKGFNDALVPCTNANNEDDNYRIELHE